MSEPTAPDELDEDERHDDAAPGEDGTQGEAVEDDGGTVEGGEADELVERVEVVEAVEDEGEADADDADDDADDEGDEGAGGTRDAAE
jgi:hypothetical protein